MALKPKYQIGDQFIIPQKARVNGCELSGLFTFVVLQVTAESTSEGYDYKYALATTFPQAYYAPKDIIHHYEKVLDGFTQTEGYFG
jgi:hypothetical protein